MGGGATVIFTAIKQITLVSGRTYDLETHTPHHRTSNNNLEFMVLHWLPVSSQTFNGAFAIDQVISATKLRYTLLQDADVSDPSQLVLGAAFVNVGHVATTVDGGTMAVSESNRIFHCQAGGPCHDTWSSRDSVANNYYHEVNAGPFQNLGSRTFYPRSAASLNHVGKIATFTVPAGTIHALEAGEVVQITGAAVSAYNGLFEVRPNPTPTSFTYEMVEDPGADDSGTPTYARLWQTGRLVVENNVIELALNVNPSGYGQAVGVFVLNGFDLVPIPFPICKQLVARQNVIGHLNGSLDPLPFSYAVWAVNTGQAIVEENVISLNQPYPLPYNYSAALTQENRSPSGNLLRGFNQGTGQFNEELATRIEDAVIAALL